MSEILIFTEKNEKVEVDLLSFNLSNETYISDHSIIMFKNHSIICSKTSLLWLEECLQKIPFHSQFHATVSLYLMSTRNYYVRK